MLLFLKTVLRLPHTALGLQVRSALANCSPEGSVLTSLLARMIGHTLNSVSYEASSASLNLEVTPSDAGLKVMLWGLSHKLPSLLGHVLEVLEHSCAKLEYGSFSSLHEKLLRDLQNYHTINNCYLRTHYCGSIVTESPRWEPLECAEALKCVTLERFKSFVAEFFRTVYFTALVAGNVSRDKAWSITDRIRRALFPVSVNPMSASCVFSQAQLCLFVFVVFLFTFCPQDSSFRQIRGWEN